MFVLSGPISRKKAQKRRAAFLTGKTALLSILLISEVFRAVVAQLYATICRFPAIYESKLFIGGSI